MSDKTSSNNGIGFFSILALIFITLKLTGYITWSWIWVLAPIWIPTVVALTILAVVGIIYVYSNKKFK